jgi:SPP1 gp7 family putative phage head morphogenesis protein
MARRKRRLTRSQRLAKAPRLPTAAELAMRLVVARALKAFAAAVKRIPLAQFSKQPEKLDAADGGAPFKREVAGIAKAAAQAIRGASKPLALKVQRHSQGEFKRLGIDLREEEPKFVELISGWRAANVGRITSLLKAEQEQVLDILSRGENKRAEDLAIELAERLDITERKGELLAREQILTLNSQITQERHVAAGIEEYEWVTSGDERVRASHAALDGEVFRWDDPPETNDDGDHNHPGEDYGGCRCIARPILPELKDDGDQQAADSDRRVRSAHAQLSGRRVHQGSRTRVRRDRRQDGRAFGGPRKLGPHPLQQQPGGARSPRPGEHSEHRRQG